MNIRGVLRALLARTIWARGLFGVPPDRYANLYRIILPLFDLSMLVAGYGALAYGAPAFVDFSDGLRNFGLGWGIWVLVFTTMSLIGVSIPRLFVLEALGKSGMLAALVVYIMVLVILTGGGSTARFVAVGVSFAGVLLAAWRLGDIRTEVRMRRREKELEA